MDIESLAEVDSPVEVEGLAGQRELGCRSASLYILLLGFKLQLG